MSDESYQEVLDKLSTEKKTKKKPRYIFKDGKDWYEAIRPSEDGKTAGKGPKVTRRISDIILEDCCDKRWAEPETFSFDDVRTEAETAYFDQTPESSWSELGRRDFVREYAVTNFDIAHNKSEEFEPVRYIRILKNEDNR